MEKPEKKTGLIADRKYQSSLSWNAAIDAYEPYVTKLEKRLEMAEEKAKEQYQQKWDILNWLGSEGCRERVEKILVRLVKESHRKSELTDYKLDDWDKNRIAIAKKAISEVLAGKGKEK